jgi:Mlc titration factor MtfA (ptsG expression regulator)
MFNIIRNWLDRRIVARSSLTPAQWQAAFASLPLLIGLSSDEKRRLRELAILFMHRKAFEGAHGLPVTRDMSLRIALQACLPILELGLDVYRGWTSIIVYPSGFAPQHVYRDDFGVEHFVQSELSGEAWTRGPVILSWDDASRSGDVDGYNLVIHEFAHKLDMQNGHANGFPPLHPGMDAVSWSRIFSNGFEDFQRKCDAGVDLGISDYAASSPAEFFAVLSEIFFEQPHVLDRHYPSVYAQMRLYYRQDPLARKRW